MIEQTSGETTPTATPKRRGNAKNLKPAWKPGQSGNPAGRPKGARQKLGEAFLDALLADFVKAVGQGQGVDAIQKMRDTDPGAYAKMIASLLPKEIEANVNVGIGEALDALDDE